MKLFFLRAGLFFMPLALWGQSTESTFVQRVVLDAGRPYFVPTNPSVTVTISFPHEIEGFDGWAFTTDPQRNQGDFFLSFTPGNNYLSFVPIGGRQAMRNLNVIVEGKVVSLIAYPADDARKAPTSILFEDATTAKSAATDQDDQGKPDQPSLVVKTWSPPPRPFQGVTPVRLLGMLDTMKMLAQLDAQDALDEANTGKRGRRLEDAARATPNLTVVRRENDVTDLGIYKIHLTMVVRNNKLDVLAFTCLIENTCKVPLTFDPESFGIRVGDAFFRQVIGDLKPQIQPGKSEVGFFALAGGPDGRPNYLDPAQAFSPSMELLRPSVNPGAALVRDKITAVVTRAAH